MWILETAGAAEEKFTFRVPAGAVKTIGRATGAEFIVDAPLVSRLHCQLTATGATLQVKDLDSTNGTFVNDKRISKAKMTSGDRLRIGRVELKVEKALNA
jgi:two-component system cell cycle response regulator